MLEEAHSQYFSNLRECQSSYTAEVCHLHRRDLGNWHRLYLLVCLQRTPPTKWLIKLFNADYLISPSPAVTVREETTGGRGWAGWSVKSPFTILWTYKKQEKVSGHFNSKRQRGAILHVRFHWIQQDLSLYRVLRQYQTTYTTASVGALRLDSCYTLDLFWFSSSWYFSHLLAMVV